MNCPFLQDARVRYCHAAAIRKPLMQSVPLPEERCSSSAFAECPVYRGPEPFGADAGTCPYLHESHVQFCAAAPVPKAVPYSESVDIPCGSSAYRYCDVFLAFTNPTPDSGDCVEGIAVPRDRHYTPNHMWIAVAEEGRWRIGIDALLAHAIGDIEGVTFITESGAHRPAAVLRAAGIDLTVVFPHVVSIAACNSYLRADPSRLAEAPYTKGWLFRGDRPPEDLSPFISGDEVLPWMTGELHRASLFAHERIPGIAPGTSADGGTVARGLLEHFAREDRLRFHDAFFSAWVTRTDL